MNKLEIDVAKAGAYFTAVVAPQITSAVGSAVGAVTSTATTAAMGAVTSAATTATGVFAAAAPVLLPVAGIGFLCWGVVKLFDD